MRYFVLNGSEELGTAIARSGGFPIDTHEERAFNGGEHKTRPLESVRGEDVYVLHVLAGDDQASANDKLLRMFFFLATLRENGAARVTALAPYLPYSRKDRQTKPRDPVTTRYVAELFEAVGSDMVVTLDVHNLSAFQNAFRCRTTHLSAAQLFAEDVDARNGQHPRVFFSPDSGGMKRVQHLREAWEATSGSTADIGIMEKRRSAGIVSGEAFAGEVEGADVIILDDLIVSGGTLARAATACKAHGARSVFAYVTHGLFAKEAEALLRDAPLDEIVVTDSVLPLQLSAEFQNERVRVLSVASLFAQTVLRLHGGGSINRLLNPSG